MNAVLNICTFTHKLSTYFFNAATFFVLHCIVLDEDFVSFEIVITIPAGTVLGEPVCLDSLQLGIVDDQIVEDNQIFFLEFQDASLPDNTVVSGVFEVSIVDNDCE